ncbi:hypothetical protein [Kribbella sp. NPDC004536]|uniref:hypothetical protein n=1 Tax=Kribbella sp. NPDC004536 TaxID=3364106 RepID=UPI0036916E8C
MDARRLTDPTLLTPLRRALPHTTTHKSHATSPTRTAGVCSATRPARLTWARRTLPHARVLDAMSRLDGSREAGCGSGSRGECP